MKTTRIKKFVNFITHNAVYTFFMFIALIIVIALIFEIFGNSIQNSVLFYDSFVRIVKEFFSMFFVRNMDNPQKAIHVITNLCCITACVVYIYYRRKHINSLFGKVIIKLKKVNYLLCIIYLIVLVLCCFYPEQLYRYLYTFYDFVKHIISEIIGYHSISVYPFSNIGLNILLRFVLVVIIIRVIAAVPQIVKYLLIDKVPVKEFTKKAGDNENVGISKKISRLSKIVYDHKYNRLRIGNILLIGVVISVIITTILGVESPEKASAAIDYFKNLMQNLLQISDMLHTPYSEPMPIAAVINILLRLLTVFVLLFTTYTIVSFLISAHRHMTSESEEEKDKLVKHMIALGILTMAIAFAVIVLYNVSSNSDGLNKVSLSTVILVFIASIIVAAIPIVLYCYYNVASKFVNLKKRFNNNKADFYKTTTFYKIYSYLFSKLKCLGKRIVNLIQNLIEPVFKEFSDMSDAAFVGASICAIASTLTTFVGLMEFYYADMITSAPMFIICTVICIFITIGIQLVLLSMGLKVGKYFRKIFLKALRKQQEVENKKQKGFRLLLTFGMFIVYLFSMTVSTSFSFASIFSGISGLGYYEDIVKTNVIDQSSAILKEEINYMINTYNGHNDEIIKKISEEYNKFMVIQNAMNVWDTNNSVDEVDETVRRFNLQTDNIRSCKTALEKILSDITINNYTVTMNKRSYMYNGGFLYSVTSFRIISPYEYDIISFSDNEQNPNILSSMRDTPLGEFEVSRFELIDMLYNEYVTMLMTSQVMYNEALKGVANEVVIIKDENVADPSSSIASIPMDQNKNNQDAETIDVDVLNDVYYDNISAEKRIYEAGKQIYNLVTQRASEGSNLSDNDSSEDNEEFTTLDQLEADIVKYVVGETNEADNNNFEESYQRIRTVIQYIPILNENNQNDEENDLNSNEIALEKIGGYYNYAVSCESKFSFGIDVLLKGHLINNDREVINNVYQKHVIVLIVFAIAAILDLTPVFVGCAVNGSKKDKSKEKE